MSCLSSTWRRLQVVPVLCLLAATTPVWCEGLDSGRASGKSGPEKSIWLEVYRQQMQPLKLHWRQLVLTIHEGRISDLQRVCPDFQLALSRVDREALSLAPDPVVRANLIGALELLDVASAKCDRRRFFALSFELYKAGYLIQVVENRLLPDR